MTVALSALRTRVQQRADQVDSNYIGTAELNNYINEALNWVHYEMTCSGIYPQESSTDITATGADSYTLPEMVSVLSVERVSGSSYTPLRRIEKPEVAALRSISSGVAIMYDVSWGLRAAPSLRLYPKPPGGVYTVRYVPPVTPLSLDADVIYAGFGWDELIVVSAAIKCIHRENGDTRHLERERDLLLARLQREVHSRDWTYANRITPTYDNLSESADFDYNDRKAGS